MKNDYAREAQIRRIAMAFFQIGYYSRALHRQTSFEMMIPNDPREGTEAPGKGMKTLFLLHGYSGKAENWVP